MCEGLSDVASFVSLLVTWIAEASHKSSHSGVLKATLMDWSCRLQLVIVNRTWEPLQSLSLTAASDTQSLHV